MPEVMEFEVTYLAAKIPPELSTCEHVEIEDVYFPAAAPHAHVRIRKQGDSYEFTKKNQIDPNDAGQQQELNIGLTAEEYAALAKGEGRKVSKTRYFLPYQDNTATVDVFEGPLAGLVIIEFEFSSLKAKNEFKMPAFCLADVTQEEFTAGGVLAGKSLKDIQAGLDRLQYKTLTP